MNEFGGRLLALRRRAGLSLRTLGQAVGLSEAYLSDLERGRRPPPPLPVVVRLARALGTEPLELALASARARGVVEVPVGDGAGLEAAVRWAVNFLKEAEDGRGSVGRSSGSGPLPEREVLS